MKCTGYNSWTSWMAATASFIVRLLITLPMRLTGLLFVILINSYDIDRESATYPVVTFGVIRTITGPFIGYLGKLFGLRPLILIGGIFASVGIGACYFANGIFGLTICLGGIYGIGLACGSTLLFAIVKRHFDKNLNFLNGFVLTGSTLGAVIMTPIIGYLYELYGASGMFLIFGAIVLNSIPASILLFDPKNKERLEFLHQVEQRKAIDCDYINTVDTSGHEVKGIVTTDIDLSSTIVGKNSFTNRNSDNGDEGIDLNFELPLPVKINSVHCFVLNSETKSEEFSKGKDVELIGFTKSDQIEFNSKFVNDSNTWKELQCEIQYIEADPGMSTTFVNKKISRKEKNKLAKKAFILFLDPTFNLIMLFQSIHAFVTTLNWTVLLDYANDKGIGGTLPIYFIMLLPVGETFGNLSLNWVVDRHFLKKTILCTICFIFMGVTSICIVWTYDFLTMLCALLAFAFFSGVINTLFPGLIFEFIDEELQSMALASRFLLYAFLCVCKSPIIGYFRGTLGSYDYVYYIIGGLCFMCGILTNLTPVLASRRIRKKAKKELKKSQEKCKS